MTTPLFLLRCVQLGLSIGELDLLTIGLVIAFRYLLLKQDFLEFKRVLIDIINKYIKNSGQISESSLLDIMGFPANWKDITRYRI